MLPFPACLRVRRAGRATTSRKVAACFVRSSQRDASLPELCPPGVGDEARARRVDDREL